MNRIRTYIFVFFLFLLADAKGVSNVPTLRSLSVDNGLSDLVVNALYKDTQGFVWIGTGTALDRFDGVHIKNYFITGFDERLKRVNVVTETEGHQIWMGNGMGLWRLHQGNDKLEQVVPDLINTPVHALLPDGKGTLYIGSEQGLFICHEGVFEQVTISNHQFASSNIINGLAFDRQGFLWMATEQGLYSMRLTDRKLDAYHYEVEGEHLCAFQCISCIGNKIYLGTMDLGILLFDIPTARFDKYIDVGCNVISSLSCDEDKTLYVSTDGNGVHFIDTEYNRIVRSFCHGTDQGGIRSNSVYSLLVDKEGLMWIGFYQSGLDYTLYQNELFSTYSFPPYFDSKGKAVRSLVIGKNEKLIGTRDGLYYIDEQRKRFKCLKQPELRSSIVFSLLPCGNEYYVGTYGGGLHIFNPQTMEVRDFETKDPHPFHVGHIFCLRYDDEGTLWIGTSDGLFRYKNGRRIAHYTSANSQLPSGNVYEIYFDSTRKGWICTENGLCIYEPASGTLRSDIFPEGFVHKQKIRVVYEDSAHQLYFVPDKGMLFVSSLTMNSFRYLPSLLSLQGADGVFMVEDGNQWLWIGTSNGLFHYDKKNNCIPYTFVDGIPMPTFTLCPPVCDERGNFWFGNAQGLLYLDIAKLNNERHNAYPVQLTDIKVNGESTFTPIERSASGEIKVHLSASQRNVSICFSDFSYTLPDNMSYECKLEGVDPDWVVLRGRSERIYYNLSSGNYLFRVRHRGEPTSEVKATISIAATWGHRIFVGMLMVVLCLLIALWYFMRRRRLVLRVEPEVLPKSQESILPADVFSPVSEATDVFLPVEKEEEIAEVVDADSKPVAEKKYKTLNISEEECRRLAVKLEEVMQNEKPYIQADLKIAELAAVVGASAHTLSYLFNHYLERNYYDYINDFRIAEFKRLVATTDDISKFTLTALAQECGFNSRASFFRYFKKVTGITPSEYIQQKEK